MLAIRLLEPARARPGEDVVLAGRFLEPSCVRASRLPSGRSGENVSVSSDDSRERERVSAPSWLPRLPADSVLRLVGRPWFG